MSAPQRDADDWAYSQLNLGQALRDLSRLREGEDSEARSALQDVIDRAGDIRNPTLVGSAHQALGEHGPGLDAPEPEDFVDAYEAGRGDEEPDPTPALQAARAHLEAAKELSGTTRSAGRERFTRSARCLDELGESEPRSKPSARPLQCFGQTTVPDACKNAAWHLGSLLAEREDWTGAATAMREAVEAAELAFHGTSRHVFARTRGQGRRQSSPVGGVCHRARWRCARRGAGPRCWPWA